MSVCDCQESHPVMPFSKSPVCCCPAHGRQDGGAQGRGGVRRAGGAGHTVSHHQCAGGHGLCALRRAACHAQGGLRRRRPGHARRQSRCGCNGRASESSNSHRTIQLSSPLWRGLRHGACPAGQMSPLKSFTSALRSWLYRSSAGTMHQCCRV